MIVFLRNAFGLLDQQGRDEVFQFIISNQNADGGFQDRGGRSDLYYSLFGMLILKALEKPEIADKSLQNLKKFVGTSGKSVSGFIEKCCLVLLQKELNAGSSSRIYSFFSLMTSFWNERASINLSYRSFVLFLTLDAVLPFPGLLKQGAKKMMSRSFVDQYSPCSEVAAKVFLKKMMNQDAAEELELLHLFCCDSGGFKAFAHLGQADMLSTAVALFALKSSGSDLRLLKPASLDFIGSNYSEGAFLSGDGDMTRDVEYTFYGLLALGVLAE